MIYQNKVFIQGRSGKDAEILRKESFSVASFSLATERSYKDKDGEFQKVTEWHDIKTVGKIDSKLVNLIEKHVKKGTEILVEGRIETERWESKEGENRSKKVIILIGIDIDYLSNKDLPTPEDYKQPELDSNNTDSLPF